MKRKRPEDIGITEAEFNDNYEDILALLRANGRMSYSQIGQALGKDPEFIRSVVGVKFVNLTKDIVAHPLDGPDEEFFLLGDNIKEICNNKEYLRFKQIRGRSITAMGKMGGLLGRLRG
jgi:hypothetical protein